ncbi:calcium-binding protein [Pacificibacter maritimus]|nr:calcium-binding protein [Pacificibacter maritimus]
MFTESEKSEDAEDRTEADSEISQAEALDASDEGQSTTSNDDTQEDEPFDFVTDGQETDIEGFVAGEDTLTLHLTDGGSGEFIVEPMQDESGDAIGVSLSYLDGDTETTLNFFGMNEVPADDISVGITSQDTGFETLYSLTELGDFGAIEPNDPEEPDTATPSQDLYEEVLAPSDPEEPATAVAGNEDDVVLAPNEPDDSPQPRFVDHVMTADNTTLVLPDSPFEGGADASIVNVDGIVTIEATSSVHRITGTDGADAVGLGDAAAIVDAGAGDDQVFSGDGTAILSGGAGNDLLVGGNDTGSDYLLNGGEGNDTLAAGEAAAFMVGGEGTDTLVGGAGDDTLVLDSFDVAEGGAGVDTFWVYDTSDSGTDFAQITDFQQGQDMLHVSMPASSELSSGVDVQVTLAEDGVSSQVTVNGETIALLHGVSNIVASDIIVDFNA